jgi:ligand-binding sensor domain-containing protein/putative methionine-R-sulfoxide reductase with GAF domain
MVMLFCNTIWRIKSIVLTFYLVFFCLHLVYAQQYNFDYINYKNGLVNNTVRSIYQDKKGIMYFGTNSGISIYYGNSFKNIDVVDGKKIGTVNQIIGNNKDSIYITTSIMPQFYNLKQQQLSKNTTQPPVYIYSMYAEDDRLYVCSDDGLRTYENNQFKKINLLTKDSIKFISKIISCNKDLWLIGRLGGSMELVNKKTLQTTAISPVLTATQFYKDAAGNVWIATKDKGVLYLSASDIIKNTLTLSPIPNSLQFLSNSEINDITSDKNGNIYIATVSKGLVKMHPDKSIEIINTKNGLSSLNVRTAFVDRENNLWIGTNMGLDKLSSNTINIYNDRFGLQSNICYDAALLGDRYLVTPNNLGYSVIDDKAKSIINYPLNIQNESYPFRVFAFNNNVYLLNKNSVSIANKRFISQPYSNTIFFDSRINILTSDNKNNILVGGIKGIWQINNKKPLLLIEEKDVRTILVDENDVLWIGKYDNGIIAYKLLYNNQTIIAEKVASFNTKYYQDHSRVLISGNNNTVWYGTRFSGLYQLVLKDTIQKLQHFTAQNGLSSDFVQSLCLINKNNLLIGTADGLDMIEVKNKPIVSTAIHKKLNFSSKINQIKLADNGKIWMATDDGIINMNVDELIAIKQTNIPVLIPSVKLKDGDKIITDLDSLVFKHNQNNITIWYFTPTYINEHNILYSWMLKSSNDTSWSEPLHNNAATFNDIKPGKYIFVVKALDGVNNNEIGRTELSFTIGKPFWQQTWFLLFILTSFSFLIYYFIKQKEKSIAQKEAQKTELQKIKTEAYQSQLEIEQIINYFATSMNTVNSKEEILWDVAKNCISKLGFEDCVIYLLDDERNVLVQKAAWGPKTIHENRISDPLEIPMGKGIVGSAAASKQPIIVANTSMDERYIVDDEVRKSEIAVPIINNNKILGVIDSEHPQQNFYTQRHLQILNTIAALCADKIIKLDAQQKTREKEIEVLKLHKDSATSQLTALRTQMNPHFIFNALNSIQQYMLQGNVVEANKYLSKFSKLQRDILNCSNQAFISLEKENEILNTYLQLEQLRFGDTFSYEIRMVDDIDAAEIKIPPMMLQPFVENAIWHGLMPKADDKKLSINFSLYSDDILLAIIKDNGIGREASAKLKKNNGNGLHQSKGMSMVEQRLQLLQQQYDKPFDIAVTDILDMNGVVKGTQVALKIFIGNK